MSVQEIFHGCRIQGCRHKYSHTTYDHVCGICGERGHGAVECNSNILKRNIKNFWHETMPVQYRCIYPGCTNKCTHSINAHHCINCGLRTNDINHSNYCKVKNLEISNFTNKKDLNTDIFITDIDFTNFFQQLDNVYIRIDYKDNYENTHLFVRKNNGLIKSVVIECYNDWSIKNDNDNLILRYFIKSLHDYTVHFRNVNSIIDTVSYAISATGGYDSLSDDEDNTIFNTFETKKCPLCRTDNGIQQCLEIKGSSEECKVCMANNVEIFFVECKHACICKTCFKQL